MPSKIVTCVDVHGGKHDVPVSSLTWRPSAYAIVIKDGALLVSPQFDGYDLPGGGIDLGETPEEAAVRETKEETGIDVENPMLVAATSSFFRMLIRDRSVQSIMMYYSCTFKGGQLSVDGFDEFEKEYARMPEWLPLEKLNEITVASSIDWRTYVRKVADENPWH
ncbi:MAG: NUDIX domain-containing protein [Candidatus Saccharimonadales bacterium]